MLADEGSFEEWDREIKTKNPLNFKGYKEKVEALQEKTKLEEAIVTGKIRIDGMPAVVGVCDGRVPHGEHGRGGRRENCPRCGAGNRKKNFRHYFCLLRRREDAGGDCIPDADG